MKQIATIVIFSLCYPLTTGSVFADEPELKIGTEIEISLLDPLSTKDNQQGQRFRAFLLKPIKIDGVRGIAVPEGTAAQGRIVELRKGKFGGGVSAKRRAKIAFTLTAIEINDEMTPVKTTTNIFEMTKNGDVAGRAVAGAAAGALGSRLVGSDEKTQTTAAAVGAMLGMLGPARQLTFPVETEMHFLLTQALPLPHLEKEQKPKPIIEINRPTIEMNIDGRSTFVSLQQSLTILRVVVENHTMPESSEWIAAIDSLESRLEKLEKEGESAGVTVDVKKTEGEKGEKGDVEDNKDTFEKIARDIRDLRDRVYRLENPTLMDRIHENPFFASAGLFGFFITAASLFVGAKSAREVLRDTKEKSFKEKINALAKNAWSLLKANQAFWILFAIAYISALIIGFLIVDDMNWIYGGLLVLLIPSLPSLGILAGVQSLSD